MVLQQILMENLPEDDRIREMYYRSDMPVLRDLQGTYLLKKRQFYDFSTYFNSLSLEKWKMYSIAEEFYLELDAAGKFVIELMGHYVNHRNEIQKEWLGRYSFDSAERKKVKFPYPRYACSTVVAFQITVLKETYIYGGSYTAQVKEEQVGFPRITMVTTTFCKESYVMRNIDMLRRTLFQDEEFGRHFKWKIIDNGNTLNPDEINSGYIEVIPNKNVGGAGGFARGMMAALEDEEKPTHVLLMDDDVVFIVESFKRLCTLLKLLKPEFGKHFISGAMLEISQRNIQHEDVGLFSLCGEHGPAKPRYDLGRYDSVIRNEEILGENIHQYSGWWYCCIPSGTVRGNLPLPFFIRGDDVEYSIRCHAKFITMNGICIWHEGFGGKFSGALELYQVHRNDLILQAMRQEEIADVKIMERITILFWEEIYKFNYRGADLLLDAVEDYLKGPGFLSTLDGEDCMKQKKAKDNKLLPVTPAVACSPGIQKLYEREALGKFRKWIYDYSYNGHRLPRFMAKKKPGIIPYGWGYYQEKQYLTRVNYAVDPVNGVYAEYVRDDGRFKELKKRFHEVMGRYKKENAEVTAAYKAAEKEMEGPEFWKKYLAK